MQLIRTILLVVVFAGWPMLGRAADASPAGTPEVGAAVQAAAGQAATAEHGEHHGLPTHAAKVFSIGPIEFTNSMMVTIIVALGIIVFAQLVSRNVQPVPGRLQNLAEWMVESMYEFLGDILGPHLIKKTFWFFGTIFFFILFTNWFGLIPGIGTIGWRPVDAGGQAGPLVPWLRGGNADLNMTSAMALLFFLLWTVWAFQEQGFVGFFKHLFAPKGDSHGLMKVFMVVIFLFVGVLETMSILFRPVSLSFRLYGNIFAGENILESMMNLVPWLGWLIPLPFYFLELLVGLVQALVFTLLTAVFTLLMCEHDPEEGHGPGATAPGRAH